MTLEEEYEYLLKRYEKAVEWFENKSTVEEQEKYYDEFTKLLNRLSEIEYMKWVRKCHDKSDRKHDLHVEKESVLERVSNLQQQRLC